MSEADSPIDQSGWPTSTEPIELTAALDSSTSEVSSADSGEDWETIAFPGAMSIDAIPLHETTSVEQGLVANGLNTSSSGVLRYGNAEIEPTTLSFSVSAKTPDVATLQQQLQLENADLRDRLAQLELDLVQQQIDQQLELACTQTHAGITEAAEVSTIDHSNERLHQLLQELERSHQTTQRQQILVETLTGQLESSQERIAQLERDCALTQQRHNEQVQQVLQAESACRDLRLRLHRQQQQTLQFKAALEKCLEMPTVYGQALVPDVAIDDSIETTDPLAALLQLKNQPVKPWSLPQQATDALGNSPTELPKPLFQLLNGLSTQGNGTSHQQEADGLMTDLQTQLGEAGQTDALSAPVDPSALLDSDDPQFVTQLMQLIFSESAEHNPYTTAEALEGEIEGEPIFDVSPFLEAENATAPVTSAVEEASQRESTASAETVDRVVLPLKTSKTANQPGTAARINPPKSEPTQAAADVVVVADEFSGESQADTHSIDAALVASESLVTPVENHVVPAAPHSVKISPFIQLAAALTPLQEAAEKNVPDLKNATNSPTNTTKPIAAWTWRDRLEKASQAPRAVEPEKATPEKAAQIPVKALALSATSRPASVNGPSSNQVNSAVSSTELKPTPFSTVVPSPIVYPLRSAKKIASLAAVDLPTFPKH